MQLRSKIALLLSGAFAVVLCALYLSFPYLAQPALRYWLTPLGFEALSFVPAYPGLSGAEIRAIEWRFRGPAVEVEGRLATVGLSYDFLTASERGLSHITAEDGAITVKILPSEAPAGSAHSSGILERVRAAVSSVPVQKLSLQNISVRASRDSLQSLLTGNATLQPKEGQAVLTVANGSSVTVESVNSHAFRLPQLTFLLGSALNIELTQGGFRTSKITVHADVGNLTVGGFTLAIPRIQGSFAPCDYVKSCAGTVTVPNITVAGYEQFPVSATLGLFVDNSLNVTLGAATVRLLEGQVTLDLGDLWRARGKNTGWKLPVTLTAIDIGRLLDLYPSSTVGGNGVLDGSFVVLFRPQGEHAGFSIEGGTVAARPPGGVIRYGGPGFEDTHPASMALKVLEDFHYRTLRSVLSLAPDGKLELAIALEGANPGWQNGKEVVLNLNIEENVGKLLKTIRLAKGSEKELNSLIAEAQEEM